MLSPVRFSFRRRSESPSYPRRRRRRKEIDEDAQRTRGEDVKTSRERADEKRAEKLEHVREQVESGSLVIRPMTEAERRRYPPVEPQPKSSGRWRSSGR